MIRESAGAVVPEDGSLTRIRHARFDGPGFDRSVYATMVEMGWLALRLPEEAGGLGLAMADYCALTETLGAGLVPEPLIPAALAWRLLGDALPEDVVSGDRLVLAAWQDAPSSLDWRSGATHANGSLSGRKLFVPGADGADLFAVVTADGVCLVDAGAKGVRVETRRSQDGGTMGTLHLDNVSAESVATPDVDAALDEACLASAAYLFGLAERVFAMTVDYLKVRKQFDRPIGSFQGLQHRAVDLKIQIELARASVDSAAAAIDSGAGAGARAAAVSAAKARATDTALLAAKEAVQMHGAIGYTDESDVSLYVRKAMTVGNLFGSATLHRARYAAVCLPVAG
jgi:alkylation response protein AidB-like acyl-CoA dehydrogenase